MPTELLHVQRSVVLQHDIDDVPAWLSIAQPAEGDSFNLVARLHDPFGEKKSGRELEVVAGGAHGDGHRGAVDANLERLLAGEIVEDVSPPAASHSSTCVVCAR